MDRDRLCEALALAETSFGLTEPNPRVGCVIGFDDGRVIGRGATQQAGGPHAEVMAIRDAQAKGAVLKGATAWVTLEPCAHHGRTPPCCDALIAAGIGRVVAAIGDPFPQVDGAGLARLRAAGVDVVMASADRADADRADGASAANTNSADADIAQAARNINIGFFSRVQRGRPWVRLKVAASLDAVTALHNGQSQWITGEAARHDGHRWRKRSSAVLTGIGTVLADDPRLDVRHVETPRQPDVIVVDSHLRLPPGARLLQPPARVQVFTAADPTQAGKAAPAAVVQALRNSGATLHHLPGPDGRVDLPAMLRQLAQSGVNELHVEAGAVLNGALLAAGLVDELLIYLAPRLLGPGRPWAASPVLQTLAGGIDLQLQDLRMIGNDIRILARPIRSTAAGDDSR
ncbi:MAG: dihydrofolate reductase family protein [Rubrivivax sp.]|nr:dihydrofolate reductase family protein [Rubrivivax sp.]